jgi:hypothetical protein
MVVAAKKPHHHPVVPAAKPHPSPVITHITHVTRVIHVAASPPLISGWQVVIVAALIVAGAVAVGVNIAMRRRG